MVLTALLMAEACVLVAVLSYDTVVLFYINMCFNVFLLLFSELIKACFSSDEYAEKSSQLRWVLLYFLAKYVAFPKLRLKNK